MSEVVARDEPGDEPEIFFTFTWGGFSKPRGGAGAADAASRAGPAASPRATAAASPAAPKGRRARAAVAASAKNFESRPPKKDKPIDPDNPFAAGAHGAQGQGLTGDRRVRPASARYRCGAIHARRQVAVACPVLQDPGLAAKVISSGHLRVNGDKALKPARSVAPGDVLTFAQARRIRVVKILALSDRRGPAPEAQGALRGHDPRDAAKSEESRLRRQGPTGRQGSSQGPGI